MAWYLLKCVFLCTYFLYYYVVGCCELSHQELHYSCGHFLAVKGPVYILLRGVNIACHLLCFFRRPFGANVRRKFLMLVDSPKGVDALEVYVREVLFVRVKHKYERVSMKTNINVSLACASYCMKKLPVKISFLISHAEDTGTIVILHSLAATFARFDCVAFTSLTRNVVRNYNPNHIQTQEV